MALLTIALAAVLLTDTLMVEERIDLYDPTTGAYVGTEHTWFGADGRRLRLEITDAEGEPSLRFFLIHDVGGREVEAFYFEGVAEQPAREVFSYTNAGRLKTTTYYAASGTAGSRTESDLDAFGREIRKRYFRSDGSQYGAENVFWNADGSAAGWDFRYVERDGGASFRYAYDVPGEEGAWSRRVRSRDGVPERVEVRTVVAAMRTPAFLQPAPFAPGRVSTNASETSPSFTRDGRTMVFARYGDDWTHKEPYIARLRDEGWEVERLEAIASVYNLAIAPDGSALIYATRKGAARALFRVRRRGHGWSTPENISEAYGLVGTYPCLTDEGHLLFFDAEGVSGAGLYLARRDGGGFAPARPFYTPDAGPPFDGYAADVEGTVLATRCFDEVCLSGPENGFWALRRLDSGAVEGDKLSGVPYGWGAQPVDSLGLLVFTDGEEILALPLRAAGIDP